MISAIHSEIDKILPEFPNIHGTVMIAIGKQVLWHQGFLSEKNIIADKDSQYLIASITKTFTSALILKIFLERFKNLGDFLRRPLSDFLSSSHAVWKDQMPDWANIINIHQCLSHTSGIEKLDKPLLHKPGSLYSYSNCGYILLGHVIETLIDEPIDVYFKRALFKPAKMKDTFFVSNGTPESIKEITKFQKLALGFERKGNNVEIVINKPNFSDLFTAGAIVSTADDLIKWNYALYNGHVIPLGALKLMIAPVVRKQGFAFYDGDTKLFSGYGIDIIDHGTTKIYQHCGGTLGYQSKISYDSTTQISIVNLSNLSEETPQIFAFVNKLRKALRMCLINHR